jgi:hypothetical protein
MTQRDTARRSRRDIVGLAAWCSLAPILMSRGVLAAAKWFAISDLFVLVPDPPKEGQDVEVVYIGNNPKTVSYRVGDGDSHKPTIGPDGRFTIPKGLLDADQDLILEDLSIGEGGVTKRRIAPP